ncbi:MAG: type II secretion system F family protein [Planctomycetes bacterium]|nr:type II secretion system F family protein [Planctomycetota bacterium]
MSSFREIAVPLWSSGLMIVATCLAFLAAGPIFETGLERALGRQGHRLRSLGLNAEFVSTLIGVWVFLTVALFLWLGVSLQIWPLAIVVCLMMLVAPRWIVALLIRRRERLFRDQMASACFSLGCAVRAGLALPEAITRQSRELPQPLAQEFRIISQAYGRGQPLRRALEEARDKLALEPFSLFVMVLSAALERGGPLDESLARIAGSIFETQRVERKLEIETASGRKSISTLACFPFLFLGGSWFFVPSMINVLFETIWGQWALAAIALLVGVAFVWGNAILNRRF